ncbi:MAG TPA: hypothetical protein VMW43_09995 [Bacteroidota bacterium]|nr:hypothetical protein [Bacteroidota bacterium]
MESAETKTSAGAWPVPRRWLYAVSGIIWCGVGSLLCTRGWLWVSALTPGETFLLESIGIAGGCIFYYFGFSRITRRNIARISSLPERPSVFLFTARRGYILIGLMMSGGYLLRNSAVSKTYLSVPYTAMGGALLIGGLTFLAVFFRKERTR